MNRIFIEAKHKNTSEYYFLKAILDRYFPEKVVEFIFMDGVGNLFKEANMNIIHEGWLLGLYVVFLAVILCYWIPHFCGMTL